MLFLLSLGFSLPAISTNAIMCVQNFIPIYTELYRAHHNAHKINNNIPNIIIKHVTYGQKTAFYPQMTPSFPHFIGIFRIFAVEII